MQGWFRFNGLRSGKIDWSKPGPTLAQETKENINSLNATQLAQAINGGSGNTPVKYAIANYINYKYGSNIDHSTINASEETLGGSGKVKVTLTGGVTGEGTSSQTVISDPGKDVKVTINVTDDNKGNLDASKAKEIANKIASFVAVAALANKLSSTINSSQTLTTNKLKEAIGTEAGQKPVQTAISALVLAMYGATVNTTSSSGLEITAADSGATENNLKVVLQAATSGTGIAPGDGSVPLEFHGNTQNKGVKVTIQISGAGSLNAGAGKNNNETSFVNEWNTAFSKAYEITTDGIYLKHMSS